MVELAAVLDEGARPIPATEPARPLLTPAEQTFIDEAGVAAASVAAVLALYDAAVAFAVAKGAA